MDATENRLANEKSPYLLQHRYNPVAWHPWGEEAFALAKKESKPVFLSIGYSTCYWCHVMEQDSFERKEVAEILNQHYISIKVDREERPDLDQIYMDAIQALSGHGGWPMSVFLTPEKKPFWGGTFFYRDQFIKILNSLAESWTANRGEIEGAAEKITEHLAADRTLAADSPLDDTVFRLALANLTKRFDSENGGFGGAPKFPPSGQIGLLFRIHRRSGDPRALEMAVRTLDAMADGGIYDHLEWGFHRYSTDAAWAVPHFEKMLYDNALLIAAYLEGFQVTKDSRYREIAAQTIEYVLTRMTAPEGGFFSAEDAGHVGREGEFYVWSFSEIKEALSEKEFEAFRKYYRISEAGNFEGGRNVLIREPQCALDGAELQVLDSAKRKLLSLRNMRPRPALDDKILTAWNGLMIAALVKGYRVLDDLRYLQVAKRAAEFILSRLFCDGALLRRYRAGEARFNGLLEDYSALIGGLLALAEIESDGPWLSRAIELQADQDSRFGDRDNGGYQFSDAEDLIFRKREYLDGALPSGNSLSFLNLLRLHFMTGETAYRDTALALLRSVSDPLGNHPDAFPVLLQGVDLLLDAVQELIVVEGRDTSHGELQRKVYSNFFPSLILLVGREGTVATQAHKLRRTIGGDSAFYLCNGGSCQAGGVGLGELARELGTISRYSWV